MQSNLVAMAMEKDKADRRVEGFSEPIRIHIMKCLLDGQNQAKPHWISEMSAWYFRIADLRLKPKAKKIPYSMMEDWDLYKCDPHKAASTLQYKELDEYVPAWVRTARDYEELARPLKEKFNTVIDQMATFVLEGKDNPAPREIRDKLTELLK